MCGGARILTHMCSKNCKIRIRLGESLSEVNSALNYKNSTNDHALRDIKTKLISLSDMTFCQSGFRFLRIDFLVNCKIRLKSVYAENHIFKGEQINYYRGSDKLIQDIFFAAKRTIDYKR